MHTHKHLHILLTQNSTTQALNHEARIKRKRAQSGTKNIKRARINRKRAQSGTKNIKRARINRKRAQNGTKNIKMVTKKF